MSRIPPRPSPPAPKDSERVILALDAPDLKEAEKLIKDLTGVITFFKIGLELFSAHGWKAVDLVKKAGARIFLDLKLHDIPNTAGKAAAVIVDHGVDMTTVHAMGGLEMMRAVRTAVNDSSGNSNKAVILGVTVLTSLNKHAMSKELGIQRNLEDQVIALACLAKQAGLDGVVSSPQEISLLRKRLGDEFLIVTPGIRPTGSSLADQKRTLTPKEALSQGANYIVIGRPITASPNPRKSAQEISGTIIT